MEKNKSSKTKQALIIVCLLFGCLMWISYVWLRNASCPEYPEKIFDALEYIDTVWPPPNSEIEFRCYMKKKWGSFINSEGSITVAMIPIKSFRSQEVDYQEARPDKVFPPFENRVSLYVDERQVEVNVQVAGSDGTPYGDRFANELEYLYVFRSNPLLFPGNHKVKVVTLLKNGERVEYEWRFKIR